MMTQTSTNGNGNGNGLNDLYIACDTQAECDYVRRVANSLEVTLKQFSPNPESDWNAKRCFEIPFREDLQKHFQLMTRADYMEDSSARHNDYYSQFVTQATIEGVSNRIGLPRLTSLDKHLNGHYQHSNGGRGGWVWDSFSFDRALLAECGSGGISPSDCTCVAKSAARQILAIAGYAWDDAKGKWTRENIAS